MQLLCSPRCSFEPQNRGPASDSRFARLRAGLDFLFDARRNELDILSAYASPERIPKKRQGAYNTLAVSNEGRAFIVDNQTLEGEPPSCSPPLTVGAPST